MNFQHFIYTLLNILNEMSPYILLGFLLAGLMHAFIRQSTMARHLSGSGWKPVLKAAILGVPLPLCSCGVLPTAVAMHRQGASKGASTSFLIATPQTGVDSIAATYALLGLPFAIIRPIAALTGSFFGGMAVDRSTKSDQSVVIESDDIDASHDGCCSEESCCSGGCSDGCCSDSCSCSPAHEVPEGFMAKLVEAVRYGFVDMVASVGKWLVIGLFVAAVITVVVPDSLFIGLAQYPLLAMLVMVAVAIPMYVCATGSIPIALSLMLKGLTPGVGFVLLMAGPAANFASVMVLRKNLGRRATAIYVLSVVVTAIAFGLAIDYLLPAGWFQLSDGNVGAADHCHMEWAWFPTLCSALLVALLIYAFVRSRRAKKHFNIQINNNSNQVIITEMHTVYNIQGMNCQHCKASVERAISAVAGVTNVVADIASGQVVVTGAADPKAIADAVDAAGFTFLGKI